ncbi:hypothetical protein IMZ31_21510 (plasmid) [Pontibacillus sp. ALD_SL1]|uniref:hypothetical protein n=1 Tax=Pontibacillus sp. ALD_SL1 TaxID=2777185 RepID=UPI001A95AA5A|nr:hypothetical protein [Pontibacillus sp. ALD_SL1]QST02031.1 hypothetical protein IMZ31_21510 [Pontibacillus sp. ALD_SL1]
MFYEHYILLTQGLTQYTLIADLAIFKPLGVLGSIAGFLSYLQYRQKKPGKRMKNKPTSSTKKRGSKEFEIKIGAFEFRYKKRHY